MRTLLLSIFILVLSFGYSYADTKILDIQEVTTKTGLTAWLVEDHSVPVISVHFAFKGSGTRNDTQDKQGMVQILSNTMDEGAGSYDSQSFQKTLNDNSISLSFSAGRDNFGGALKTLTRNKSLAFDLLELALTKPRFDEEPVQRMIDANLSRIRQNLTDPSWIAARLTNDMIYEGHPYALNSGGTLTSLPKTTSADLRKAHKNLIKKNRLIIAVAGDITPDQLKKQLEDVFGRLPKDDEKDDKDVNIEPKRQTIRNQGKSAHFTLDVPQSVVSISTPGIDRTDPNFYAAQVMNHIFGAGGFGSRLTKQIREERGLTYGIYSRFTRLDGTDSFHINSSTQTQSLEELITVTRAEMNKMQNTPVSDEELKDAKSYITGALPISFTSNDAIAGTLLSLQEENLPIDYLDTFIQRIIGITSNDILRVATRVLDPKNMVVVTVGQTPPFKDNTDTLKLYEALPNAR